MHTWFPLCDDDYDVCIMLDTVLLLDNNDMICFSFVACLCSLMLINKSFFRLNPQHNTHTDTEWPFVVVLGCVRSFMRSFCCFVRCSFVYFLQDMVRRIHAAARVWNVRHSQ